MRKFLCITLCLICVLLLAACNKPTGTVTLTVAPVEGAQSMTASWTTSEAATKVELKVLHGEQIVDQKVLEGDALNTPNTTLNAYYGKFDVNIKATLSNGSVVEQTQQISFSADEYVIAPISGSMPQLYFTLNIDEITNNGTIPTFVWLARPGSWNWDKLPTNVYAMPTVDISRVLIQDNYDEMVAATEAYIAELHEINPNAKFNLYINDFNTYLYLKLLVGNGVPEENFYVTLLSDGGASYKAFNTAFNSDDPNFDADAKYSQMAANLNKLYEEVAAAKDYAGDGFTVSTDDINQYAYVAAREKDNVEWWILRPRAGVLCSPDEEFITRVLNEDKQEGIIEERNFATPLKNMSDEQKAALKSLYNFNDEMFQQAEKDGKKAMMILGSWATAENEPDFESYVKLVKAYYGEEEYVYYYKGHPNTPTSLYPEKQAQLEELGLVDVESSINAELILFFYPDIYMCGYNSSTFLSVEQPEMACAMFNMSKAEAEANEGTSGYRDLIGLYLSKIGEDSPYKELCGEAGGFLVEFHRDTHEECDFAIYDVAADAIRYYKQEGTSFTEITG